MISDLLQTVQFVANLSDRQASEKAQLNLLYRSLRVEMATNLNLIRSVHDRLMSTGTTPGSETMVWLTQSLTTDAARALLLADPRYLDNLSEQFYQEDTPDSANALIPNLEGIVIKVTELQAIANAPEDEALPTFDWKRRIGHVRALHLSVLSLIKAQADR